MRERREAVIWSVIGDFVGMIGFKIVDSRIMIQDV